MALNPNIIANAMSNITAGMPDASNLMAQRVQGMENIYKIERQREADVQAAAAAQAEELTAALSPAIAAAFSDPSDEGLSAALGMVPEQYRSAAQAQLDQLRSIGDLNQRKNIMRAALVQDDVGQRLLAQLEPTANMRLQADTAAAAQALKMRELQLKEQEFAASGGVSPDVAAQLEFEREKLAAEQAAKAAVASGEAPPVDLQKGEEWNRETRRVQAVPGSELYRKQKAEHVKDYKEAEGTLQRLENVLQVATDLKNTTGWQKAFGTGAIMSRMPNTPLSSVTGAYDFQTKYDNLTGAVKEFGRAVASMQGKLGNMAVQEWKNVADSVAAMDLTKMSGAELDSQLDRIADQINVAKNNIRRAYDLEYSGTQFYEPLSERGADGAAKISGGSAVRPAGVGADWSLEEDAQGNRAWVSPQRDKFIEAQ